MQIIMSQTLRAMAASEALADRCYDANGHRYTREDDEGSILR